LKSALARAVEQQALSRNPATSLRLPKVPKTEVTALTVEQTKLLLKSVAHTKTYWPTLVAVATGMRRGEILALRWKNVDLDQGVATKPPSVEYRLTELGESLLVPLVGLIAWAESNKRKIATARTAFDAPDPLRDQA
jgi:integrase